MPPRLSLQSIAQLRPGIVGGGGAALLTFTTTSVTPTTFDPVATLSGGAPTPEWTLGDGTVLTTASISHTYASAGTKTVTLGPVALYPFVTVLDANTDNLTSIAGLSKLVNLVNLYLGGNQLTGTIPDFSANTALVNLYLYSNQLTGTIPDFSANTALVTLYLYSNQLTGTIPDFSANTALVTLHLFNNQLTGTIPDFSANTALVTLRLDSNQLSDIADGSLATPKLDDFQIQNNAMTQSEVDAVISQIYANRAIYTSLTPSLNIAGTNAAPSGTYQYAATPTTGKEMIYALVNDTDAEGFNKWAVVYTA